MALGEKRNGSVFATAAQPRDATEYQVTSEPEVVPVVVDDTPQRTLNTDIGTLGRAHNLFFTPSAEGRDFNSVLQEVQEYISGAYAALITEGGEDSKEQLMRYITKYLQDQRIAVAGMTQTELVDAIYSEMAEFGFLTRYIYADGIEEININSWRDIEVQYSDGRSEKLTEHFDSPEHALAVIRRMLHASGMVLDNASPLVTGHLTRNTRIAAMKAPVVDEDVGVAASIRIVNRHNLSREDLLRSGTATAEMLDWLSVFLRYGISICVAGATSSGKTTAAGWLLTTIPDSKRIFTIENGSRELELVREENGKRASTGLSAYTSRYALSDRLVCGECGTLYRRCTWTRPDGKRVVWRCVSRLDYGKKYCHSSPTLDEVPLQQAIIAALNTVLPDLDGRIRQITEALEAEVIPFPGSGMSLGDIDRRLTELEAQFQRLLEKAADDPIAYGDQFKEILDEQTALKELRTSILAENKEHAEADRRISDAAGILENAVPHIAEWDESAIRQLVAQVKVLSKNEISVTLKSGIEIRQSISN